MCCHVWDRTDCESKHGMVVRQAHAMEWGNCNSSAPDAISTEAVTYRTPPLYQTHLMKMKQISRIDSKKRQGLAAASSRIVISAVTLSTRRCVGAVHRCTQLKCPCRYSCRSADRSRPRRGSNASIVAATYPGACATAVIFSSSCRMPLRTVLVHVAALLCAHTLPRFSIAIYRIMRISKPNSSCRVPFLSQLMLHACLFRTCMQQLSTRRCQS